MVGDRTLHDGIDRLPVGKGVVESAQHHRGDALAPPDAVGAQPERFTATVRRGQPGLGVEDRKRRCQNEIRASRNDGIGLTRTKRGAALVDGGQ